MNEASRYLFRQSLSRFVKSLNRIEAKPVDGLEKRSVDEIAVLLVGTLKVCQARGLDIGEAVLGVVDEARKQAKKSAKQTI